MKWLVSVDNFDECYSINYIMLVFFWLELYKIWCIYVSMYFCLRNFFISVAGIIDSFLELLLFFIIN